MMLNQKCQETSGEYNSPVEPSRNFGTADLTPPVITTATAQRKRSVIERSVHIPGSLQSDGDIQVDGRVSGDVRCSRLTVNRGGCIIGDIIAEELVVLGEVTGVIRAAGVRMRETARVRGQIFH